MTMKLHRAVILLALGFSVALGGTMALAQENSNPPAKDAAATSAPEVKEGPAGPGPGGPGPGGIPMGPFPRPKYPPFQDVAAEFQRVDGLIPMYRKDSRLLAEIGGGVLNRDFIVLISIAKGIAEGEVLGGMSWGFGDDWLWQFRKVDDNIYIVRRNVRFRANPGSPEEKAVRLAYTDSILFSLPIITIGPSGGFVVDFSQVFMSDLPQISMALPGFFFAPNKSTFDAVKGFPENVELEVAATYASSGAMQLDTVPDSRGVTVNVHYSISLLPQTGYVPRFADDRVGYFLTAVKDFSRRGSEDRFLRFINRWHLQKSDPGAEISTPVKPVTFYLEKTIPFQYRKAISDGILEWNKAFEKAGYYNAIQVIQQDDKDEWDPEDIRYNTFRWITAGAGFAMGPSRVNPMTGQILDADIIFDADFVQFWKQEYEIFSPQALLEMNYGPMTEESFNKLSGHKLASHRHGPLCRCEFHRGMSREFALGSTFLSSLLAPGPEFIKAQEKLIQQGLKEVTMHEVGHTLGLRHNFKSSTIYTIAELNDTSKPREFGLTGSVMDYAPVNLVAKGQTQGDFYSTTLGPYDYWAIEYGYRPLGGGPEGEQGELKKIASRSAEPALVYSTDEDTMGIFSPDPLSNRFDLGADPVEYAKQRAQLVSELWPTVIDKVTEPGDGYQRARQAFGILLGTYGNSMFMASRSIGGLYANRDHKGDANGRAPFVIVPAAKQREALAILEEQLFNDKPFGFPPELYNHLASSRWMHWGTPMTMRTDAAVHDIILRWQEQVLAQLLAPITLDRLHDAELKIAADQDALTCAELIQRLTKAIYAEVDGLKPGEYTNRKPAISSLRRNLQRSYLKALSAIAMGEAGSPEDCRTIAFAELAATSGRIKNALASGVSLDSYSRAHLEETVAIMGKVMEARLSLSAP